MVRRAPKSFKDKAKGGKGKSLSKSAISRIMGAADSSVPGGSFSDLARADKQMQVKYDRPANLEKFVDQSRLYQKGIDAGGRVEDGVLQMIGADGIITDDKGRQILSMRQPGITAVAPRNFSEFMGDVKRAFTGYNTLSYDPNAKGTPSTTGGVLQRQEGILSNLSPLSFIPGANAVMKGIDVFRDIFFPPPPTVTYGSDITMTVSEEPSGVINALPDTSSIKVEELPSITDTTVSEFKPLDNPALYGDGTYFDKFDEQMETLGIEQDPLYS